MAKFTAHRGIPKNICGVVCREGDTVDLDDKIAQHLADQGLGEIKKSRSKAKAEDKPLLEEQETSKDG